MVKQITTTMQRQYQQQTRTCFIVNAPWTFAGVWKIVSGFMDETVNEKVQITSSPNSEKMLEMIEADQLEERFGGTSADR